MTVAAWIALVLAQLRGPADGPFERVAPILEGRCLRCHSGDRPKGGLSLETRAGLLRGGAGGPAFDEEEPGWSPLLDAVSGDEPPMPPTGGPLEPSEVDAVRAWLDAGAPWDDGATLAGRPDDPSWWSLEPIVARPVPTPRDAEAVRNPIDAFILERLDAEGMAPVAEADRRTLIRRLSFDLLGLPPTPMEVDAFVDDRSPAAFERLVDRMLASPRHGERWARHWLDLARYADTHGYDKDKRRPNAWPYRDFVIRALNDDLPFDRFVRMQIAGDALDPGDPVGVVATGFVAAGPWDFVGQVELREGTVDKQKTRVIDRDDMVAATMATFTSLTVHCARCHDHKFDPIPQRDYYRLQAVFAGVDRGDRPIAGPEGPSVYALVPIEPRPIALLERGEVEHPGPEVGPGAPSCVAGLDADFDASADEGARRLALADWIADPENPLTWRSIVNRVWQHHFGRGLVDTPSDFGRNGSTPSHPELLDWLAADFRDGGGSLKDLHRLIVTSASYRRSSAVDPANDRIDAGNRLLWRQQRRRLEAEEIRDAALAVSGELDDAMGGPGFDLFRFVDDHSPIYDHDDPERADPPEGRRRSIYRFVVRSVPNPLLECLDGADPNAGVPVRNETITALQALAMRNDPFMIARARDFADRIESMADDPEGRVEHAFRLAFGRSPDPVEHAACAAFADRHGSASLCRLLLNANEFVFVD